MVNHFLFLQICQLGQQLLEHPHPVGRLRPDSQDIAVANAVGSVLLEGEGVLAAPLAAHVGGVSAAQVVDRQVERRVLLALPAHPRQRLPHQLVGLLRTAVLGQEGGGQQAVDELTPRPAHAHGGGRQVVVGEEDQQPGAQVEAQPGPARLDVPASQDVAVLGERAQRQRLSQRLLVPVEAEDELDARVGLRMAAEEGEAH
jgi:hypothetical protein